LLVTTNPWRFGPFPCWLLTLEVLILIPGPSLRRALIPLGVGLLVPMVILVWATPAWAQTAAPTLSGVIESLRAWAVGLLAGLATLFLTIGGIRYMTAGGDPGQVERAKSALRSAAVGYVLAVLAPVLVAILRSLVGA
jgi:hypothetical protein